MNPQRFQFRFFHPWPFLLSLSALLAAAPLFAQWQKIGEEQLPDTLRASSLETDLIQARDPSGISLKNSAGELGLFIGSHGNLGISESNFANWSPSFSAVEFDKKAALMAGSTAVHVLMNAYYDGSTWRYITTDEASGYYQANGAHFFRVTSTIGSPAGVLTWTEAMQLRNDGDLVGLGSLDFEGSAEFGNASQALTLYQSPSEALFSPPSSGGMAHAYADDTIHPATIGAVEYAAFPVPWNAPGSVVQSVKFVVKMATSSDLCNFSIRRQSASAPGTTTEVVPFGGTDYSQSSGLTLLSGSYYTRTETVGVTLSGGEKMWAVVRLKSGSDPADATLHGIEWTFEKRAY